MRPIREKTLQELDGEDWGEPDFESSLVENVHRLRRVPLKSFTLEDLRLMIGQRVGLPDLVPIALNHVEKHPFAAGDFYRGDLLAAILRVDDEFWIQRPHLCRQAIRAIDAAFRRIRKIRTDEGFDKELRAAHARLTALVNNSDNR